MAGFHPGRLRYAEATTLIAAVAITAYAAFGASVSASIGVGLTWQTNAAGRPLR